MMFPWSFSSLNNYLTCPYQYYSLRVAKRYKQEETEHTRWGKDVHKAFELRFKENKPMVGRFTAFAPIGEKLASAEGDIYSEIELGINVNLEAVSFFNPNCYARGIVDYLLVRKQKAINGDFKTGKRKEGSRQLLMSAGLVFAQFPEVNEVITAYIWLQEGGKISAETYYRKDFREIWASFEPDVRLLEWSFEHNNWPKKKNGLCKNYCAVRDCEFNGANVI